jgi:hypothetical protein
VLEHSQSSSNVYPAPRSPLPNKRNTQNSKNYNKTNMSDVSSNSYFSSNNQSYKLVLPEKSASKTDQHGDNTADLKYN